MSLQDELDAKVSDFKRFLDHRDAILESYNPKNPLPTEIQVRGVAIEGRLPPYRPPVAKTVLPQGFWPDKGAPSCCLYPWPDPLGTPLYPTTDLPSAIDVSLGGAHTLIHTVGTYIFTDSTITISALNHLGVSDGGWHIYGGGFPDNSYGGCLVIEPYPTGPADQFLTTYTVNGTDIITSVGDSTIACQWTGPKTGGGDWTLDYGLTTPYKWTLVSTGGSPTGDVKTSPQSSPTGTYGSNTVA